MTTRIHYTPFSGGLDNRSSALSAKDGSLVACENFEEVFGEQGYRRIYGYERYDGRRSPHLSYYYTLHFTSGNAAILVGDLINGGTSSAGAYVMTVAVTSGSWAGGDAAGYIIVYFLSGVFVDGETLRKSGAYRATLDGVAEIGTMSDSYYAASKAYAIAAARAAITAVPGSGAILGIAVYLDTVYAARNSVDGLTANLYQSSTTGWTLIQDGFIPDGEWRMHVANFTGAAQTLTLFGVDGKNNPFYYDASTGFGKITGLWATCATSTSSVAIGTGSKTFVVTEASRNYTVAEGITVWDSSNAGNFMRGVVASWTSGTKTLVVTVSSISGSGTIAAWDIGRTDFTDKPYLLAEHKDHMFWAYRNGQLKTSDLGTPLTSTTTAALFGTGDEITKLLPLKSGNLAIYCARSIQILSGTSQIDWNKDVYSSSGGALFDSSVEVAGIAVHVEGSAIKTLQATQMFGNYETATTSQNVENILAAIIPNAVAFTGNKKSQQYRIYASDGRVLAMTITTPNAIVAAKDVSFSTRKYPHAISCANSWTLSDGTEMHLFGTSDGYVMQDDVGTSFDGAAIPAVVRTHFNNFKSPSSKKRFRKIVMELSSPEDATLNFKLDFDYADGKVPNSENQSTEMIGAGGTLDDAEWDAFRWDQPQQTQSEVNISGIGRNMSILLWHESATTEPFTMQGLITQYTPLGLSR